MCKKYHFIFFKSSYIQLGVLSATGLTSSSTSVILGIDCLRPRLVQGLFALLGQVLPALSWDAHTLPSALRSVWLLNCAWGQKPWQRLGALRLSIQLSYIHQNIALPHLSSRPLHPRSSLAELSPLQLLEAPHQEA